MEIHIVKQIKEKQSFTRMSKQILLDVSYCRQNQLKNKKQKLNLQ